MAALAFVMSGWNMDVWTKSMHACDPLVDVRRYPEGMGRLEDVHSALVWRPRPNGLKSLTKLKAVISLGAGVDALTADPTTPDIPTVRTVAHDMTMRTSEFVVMHVLMHHRQLKRIE